jgi:hypothetical protein
MILDISRALYEAKIVGNKPALAIYMRGERSWCFYGVRWIGTEASGLKLRHFLKL